MPRTKRPNTKKEKHVVAEDAFLKKIDKMVNDKKNRIDSLAQMEIRNLELAFKILTSSISDTYLQKTMGQLKTEMLLKEVPTASSTSYDDGYLTENSSQGSGERGTKRQKPVPKSAGRPLGSRSRSADPSARKAPPTSSKTVHRRRSRSVYQTPAYNKNASCNYPVITPKVTPHSALAVLRQPRQGEMVVSMAGSPVIVPSCSTLHPDEMVNCNILLQDGTMLTLQPKNLRESQAYIPFSLMDSNVLDQVKQINDNLTKVLHLGKMAFKR